MGLRHRSATATAAAPAPDAAMPPSAAAQLLLLLLLALATAARAGLTEEDQKKMLRQCLKEMADKGQDISGGSSDNHRMLCLQDCLMQKLGMLADGELPEELPRILAGRMKEDEYSDLRAMCNDQIADAEECDKMATLKLCIQHNNQGHRPNVPNV